MKDTLSVEPGERIASIRGESTLGERYKEIVGREELYDEGNLRAGVMQSS